MPRYICNVKVCHQSCTPSGRRILGALVSRTVCSKPFWPRRRRRRRSWPSRHSRWSATSPSVTRCERTPCRRYLAPRGPSLVSGWRHASPRCRTRCIPERSTTSTIRHNQDVISSIRLRATFRCAGSLACVISFRRVHVLTTPICHN